MEKLKKTEKAKPSAEADGNILEVGMLTPAEVDALRKKNGLEVGEISHIIVKVNDNENSHGYLGLPTKQVSALAVSLYHQQKIQESGEIILQNTWLAGDPRMQTVDKITISAALQAKNMVKYLEYSGEKI